MMTAEDNFAHHLVEFGLTEKEALIYFHLLKYGPNTQSRLAKALKTYREDVRRTLNGLVRKSMVRTSADRAGIYTAVDLDAALDAALKKQETELLEMEARKRELKELAQKQQFHPVNNVPADNKFKRSRKASSSS
ncbi:MAG TPA: helix-turn-helix domain-containing protein [Candidatus Acidoferrales bacterium]|nr:helix-turn-helix domain-containing protein [Candidatus Acidoferrales bacterium]